MTKPTGKPRGRPRIHPLPEKAAAAEIVENKNVEFQFVMPAAYPDEGQTLYFMGRQFEKALRSYGVIKFEVDESPEYNGFNKITGAGKLSCPADKFDDLIIDLSLVSLHWRKGLLIIDGKTVIDQTVPIHGVPVLVLENMERYLSLTGRRFPPL